MVEQVERFKRLLASRGYRVTPQRIAIYEYLVTAGTHPSADQICAALGTQFPMMSPATVYKTLELLTTLGLVLEMGGTGDRNRYDGNPDVHLNLVCVRCGKIEDLVDGCVQGIPSRVEESTGFRVVGQRYELYGVCRPCRRSVDGGGTGGGPLKEYDRDGSGRRDGAAAAPGEAHGAPGVPSGR